MIKKTIVDPVTSFLLLFAGTVGGQAQDVFVATWSFGEGDLSALHGEDMEYMEDVQGTAGKDSHSEAADQAAAFYRLAK
tara:strand:- start:232 stop:468 length:237 start_codon:yes stop_codon:yes gene_type:complete